ncbi:hypothetical protein [Novosphingobium sp.]|jgi:hypothetical protein|uniref:hypothetical protein n=1 Tax=Novosphingobium sp. TaxID=1874826 RepID=UPI0022CCB2F0|nr:hypothetical protein [Novosphingobium sp.]MCZ8018103.1 hypothetical protein [Novosphingobium sp.]MCZ8034422.1 hypothetical protein [Novosphingobium sp.]MCZ8052390.1 hypothetical protein [Novosphingobium sp.]MCZ8061255.1 hypothetical protein [Novosphingobium sp.]MCZ8232886.1 hypothetical protein [Novosphingobium sp.]
MDNECTELDRRVLAHARILQTLIRYLAEDRPEILIRLTFAFGIGHNIGADEQDYLSTEQCGESFIRAIEEQILELRIH